MIPFTAYRLPLVTEPAGVNGIKVYYVHTTNSGSLAVPKLTALGLVDAWANLLAGLFVVAFEVGLLRGCERAALHKAGCRRMEAG